MITIRKLSTLKEGTRQRKQVRILSEWEEVLAGGGIRPDAVYLRSFLNLLRGEEALSDLLEREPLPDALPENSGDLRRLLNGLRHELLASLGTAPAEWDLLHPADGGSRDRDEARRFPSRLYLDGIRSPFNLGSIFRSAECFGVSEIFLSPETAEPSHPRAQRSAMGCIDRIPWRRMDHGELAGRGEPLFAMELGGESVDEFDYPAEGILVVGSEELGVSPRALSLCRESGGIVTIPLYGSKSSLNVSVAFGIILQAWTGALAGS